MRDATTAIIVLILSLAMLTACGQTKNIATENPTSREH